MKANWVSLVIISLLLITCLISTGSISANSPEVIVKTNFDASLSVSSFNTGMSQVDRSLSYPWKKNDAPSVENAKALIKDGLTFVNQFTQAWGADDIWPDPSITDPAKWNWDTLDSQIQTIIDSGATPIISFGQAPWWMKGQLQKNGTTKLIPDSNGEWHSYAYPTALTDFRGITYPAGYVSPDPYACRILDSQMGNWTHLVEEIAKRYMVPKYNVSYFQVWNELKGYYNPILNRYDYENSPGDTTGYKAINGYTFMYNRVYEAVISAAKSLNLNTDKVKIGGPYVVIDTWANPKAGGWPSKEIALKNKDYGTYDQRALDVVKYWLQNKIGAGFITIDGSIFNKDDVNKTDPFAASEKFSDVTNWIRTLDNNSFPGARNLPIWWGEFYSYPRSNFSDAHNNAIKSSTVAKMIEAGVSVALQWGESIGETGNDAGLWTLTNLVGGGQALPWYDSYNIFHDNFSTNTPLYAVSISDSSIVDALSSLTKTLLINKTEKTVTVAVNDVNMSLGPWEVKLVHNE